VDLYRALSRTHLWRSGTSHQATNSHTWDVASK